MTHIFFISKRFLFKHGILSVCSYLYLFPNGFFAVVKVYDYFVLVVAAAAYSLNRSSHIDCDHHPNKYIFLSPTTKEKSLLCRIGVDLTESNSITFLLKKRNPNCKKGALFSLPKNRFLVLYLIFLYVTYYLHFFLLKDKREFY